MESEIKFLRRITKNKIKDYDDWTKNNDINLFVIENKEKLEEVNIYINILLQYELLRDEVKRRKKLKKQIEKKWIQI